MARSLTRTALILLLLAASGCATPVGVRRVDERTVQRTLTANVLSTGELSVASRQVLLRHDLYGTFERDPERALAELHARAIADMKPGRLFALAECSFIHAQRIDSRPYFVAASIYAYAFLFPEDGSRPVSPIDPRLRTAVDLYNRSIARALVDEDGQLTELREGSFPFHLGQLELDIDPTGFTWADRKLTRFQSAAELEVRGLRNRYRQPGIGAPFVADAVAEEGRTVDVVSAHIPDRISIPVTFFLRYRDARAALRSGVFESELEVYNRDSALTTQVLGFQVPLEYEISSALAYSLGRSRVWEFEIPGYLRGDFLPIDDRLVMLGPHVAGRIPVVFVHGTASSAGRWANMLNELQSDRRIDSRYEFWLFLYNTGNPILYSASLLREALRDTVAELDPRGESQALRNMVVIGHSQGGLLTRLQVTSSGNRFWSNTSDREWEEVAPTLEPDTRELVEKAVFFEPLPFVDRVVFISTPHFGSFLAGNWLGRLASNLFTAPQNLVGTGLDLARAGLSMASATADLARSGVDRMRGDDDAQLRRELARVPSSVDNMNPQGPFTVTLSSIPVDENVVVHSIIPVTGGPPPEGQNDGVVEFEAARIEPAASEYVVFDSLHSTQDDPRTIQEVRRILREHLDAVDLLPPGKEGGSPLYSNPHRESAP